jgi:hypothetical protein
MDSIIAAFQAMTPEEIIVVVIIGCLSFIIGIAVG